MKMTVKNKCIHVGDMKISGVGGASIVLVGDAETIANSSYFDTPANSLVFSPNIPLNPVHREQKENS
ncbi:hypothetical protein [Paenibacillus sp. UNC451MF]|uniref:hypothetical protein n=1 Tax=Paenibacillus sp. UNC451MF TaxID=1449063 RepID=UPI00048A8935|nr:hypothetical protein [Paenibacillus sp. UNC451MF]